MRAKSLRIRARDYDESASRRETHGGCDPRRFIAIERRRHSLALYGRRPAPRSPPLSVARSRSTFATSTRGANPPPPTSSMPVLALLQSRSKRGVSLFHKTDSVKLPSMRNATKTFSVHINDDRDQTTTTGRINPIHLQCSAVQNLLEKSTKHRREQQRALWKQGDRDHVQPDSSPSPSCKRTWIEERERSKIKSLTS